jgi:hypothetical protein
MRRARSAAVCLALALLAACQGDGPESQFRDYLARLGRTLDVEVPPVATTPVPTAPRSGALQLSVPPGSLDSLDFLAISGCAVQVTIGKRNSSLGRMARPSQRLLLELEYLRLAPECIVYQRERGREDLASALQQAWDQKRIQLPARIFNATLGSPEFRSFWRAGKTGSVYPEGTGSGPPAALRAISEQAQHWLAGDFEADNLGFELLLSEVATGDGGDLARALAGQGDWLAAADAMLAARAARGPLCSGKLRPAAADILPNVVQKVFVGTLQPRAAVLGRRFHELLPPLQALEDSLADHLPEAYSHWREERDALLERSSGAPRRHVQALIALQEPCAGQ